jgi:predicted phosphodiesterase
MSKVTSSQNWSDEDLEYLYRARSESVPYDVIGRELKRTAEACKSKWLKTEWDKMSFFNSSENRVKKSKIVAFEEKINKSVDNKLEMFRLRADVLGDRIENAIKKAPKIKLTPWLPKNKKLKIDSEDMGLVMSDLHIGHSHSLEETGGISEYNIDIFINRLRNLENSVADIYEIHTGLYRIPKLHIFCLGDIVDGMNNAGSWSPVYINTPIYDQIMIGFENLCHSICYWLTIFEEIHFYGVRGNHGRIAPSGAEKDYANWDNLCYDMLRIKFADNPRIKFNAPKTWWVVSEIKNHKFLLVHGDDVRNSGHAIKGLENFVQSMSGIINNKPDYTICGHFHQSSELSTNFGKMIINGSFVGGDVYSLKNLHKCTKAEQKVFGINESRGITWRYDIDLDRKRSKR